MYDSKRKKLRAFSFSILISMLLIRCKCPGVQCFLHTRPKVFDILVALILTSQGLNLIMPVSGCKDTTQTSLEDAAGQADPAEASAADSPIDRGR